MHISAQGSSKDVRKHLDSLQPVKEKGIEDFIQKSKKLKKHGI